MRLKARAMSDPVVFSRKEKESVVFVKEEFPQKNIQKKRHVFGDLTTNSLRGRYCETVCRLQGYKVIEKLDKVCP